MHKTLFIGLLFLSTSLFASDKQALEKMNLLGSKLKTKLISALGKSPEEALNVCKKEAPLIAQGLSNENFMLGRVSRKTRNPENRIQAWMYPLIEKYESGVDDAFLKVEIPSESAVGYIKPIKTKALCLMCHGTNLDPSLNKKIKLLYPSDLATGYKEGDIRGYFWVKEKK